MLAERCARRSSGVRPEGLVGPGDRGEDLLAVDIVGSGLFGTECGWVWE